MAFGFDVGPGWYPIIEELSGKLEKLIKPIRDAAADDLNTRCAGCGQGRKWHRLLFLFMTIKFFFMNKWRMIKLLPREIKRARRLKHSVWKRIWFLWIRYRWYRACRWFRLQHPRAMQVKEKFGTLRFYTTWETDEMSRLIEQAEEKSAVTCEDCGQPGQETNEGWVRTECEECAIKRRQKRA